MGRAESVDAAGRADYVGAAAVGRADTARTLTSGGSAGTAESPARADSVGTAGRADAGGTAAIAESVGAAGRADSDGRHDFISSRIDNINSAASCPSIVSFNVTSSSAAIKEMYFMVCRHWLSSRVPFSFLAAVASVKGSVNSRCNPLLVSFIFWHSSSNTLQIQLILCSFITIHCFAANFHEFIDFLHFW